MKITEETITPEDARVMLRQTEGAQQRALSEAQLNRLTHAIKEGRWQVTHQAIALDSEGKVIDGQHRLTAIIRAGIPVSAMVARQADPATFLAIDTGRSRTPGDLLHIAGFANTNAMAATARFIMAAKRTRGTRNPWSSTVGPIRHDEIVKWVQINAADLEHALLIGNRVARSFGRFGLRTWLSAGVFLIRESNIPEPVQLEFIERLQDGANLAPGSPVLAFRRYITQSFLIQSTQVKGPVGLGLMLKMFNTYVAGGNVQLAVFKIGIEKFPGVDPWDAMATSVRQEHLPLPGAMAEASR